MANEVRDDVKAQFAGVPRPSFQGGVRLAEDAELRRWAMGHMNTNRIYDPEHLRVLCDTIVEYAPDLLLQRELTREGAKVVARDWMLSDSERAALIADAKRELGIP